MDEFWEKLVKLTEKWVEIENKDFFRNIPYELSYEEFNRLIDEHDINDWIPLYCKIHNIGQDSFRIILWEQYTGKSIWETKFKRIHKLEL